MRKRSYKHFESEQTDFSDLWVTTYGDMMTNLMIFFLMLWAYTQFVKEEHYKPIVVRSVMERESEVRQELREELQGVGAVEFTKRKVTIRLPSAVLFASGSADLRAEALEPLTRVAATLAASTAVVVVEGHTDDIPIRFSRWRSNYELSAARAFSVIQYFTTQGIVPGRLAARGYGPYRPMVPNDDDEHRAQNRRIEIHLWVT